MNRIALLVFASSTLGLSGTGLVSSTGAQPASTALESTGRADAGVDVPSFTLAVGLSGYSPVSYIQENRAEPGSPRFAADHRGVTYFFTSDAQKRDFLADPERYVPAYGGYCAFGCSVSALLTPDPTSFIVIGGRTHLFLRNQDLDARALWLEAKPDDVRQSADAFWIDHTKSRAYTGGRNVPSSGLGLEGYSPVSYFTLGRAERGDPRFAVEHHGVTYHLTSEVQVGLFKADPDRFEPQCGGWCAFGMSVEDKFPVDPTKFQIVDDRLYLFLNNDQVNAAELWSQGDKAELVRRAQGHWRRVRGE